MMASVSEQIRSEMASRGVSTAELAERMGMALTQLARMLRDDDHNYSVKTLRRIAGALGCELNLTFGSDSTPEGSTLPLVSSAFSIMGMVRGQRGGKISEQAAEDFNLEALLEDEE